MRKKSTSFRLSEQSLKLLSDLATQLGISQAAVLEVAVREKWRKDGIPYEK